MSALHVSVPPGEKERVQILAHLEELLESPAFAGSRRRQSFLRYVVDETLEGRGATIKETNIAVDVFGRSSNFDAQTASIVRVTAAEVRKRLAQTYESGLGRELRIELPLGGYQPVFHFAVAEESLSHPVVMPSPVVQPLIRQTKEIRRPNWLMIAVVGCVVVASVTVLVLRWIQPPTSIDLLWKPFLSRDKPVLISLAVLSNLMYMPHQDKWLPLQPGGSIPTSELGVLDTTMVGTGGALGAALFAEQLASRRQPFTLKFAIDMSFADLKESPAVLIGTSRWTQELTRPLRFHIQAVGDQMKLIDSQRPDRIWSIPLKRQPSELAEGYALVTRLLHSESGHAVLIVAGLDARNTQAAVEFLSRSDSFDVFAGSAPRGWENKNFQIVLHNTYTETPPGRLQWSPRRSGKRGITSCAEGTAHSPGTFRRSNRYRQRCAALARPSTAWCKPWDHPQ